MRNSSATVAITRRHLLRRGGVCMGLLAAASLTGCGWRIRGAGYNFGFKRIMVLSPGQGPVVDRSLSEEERTKLGGEMAQAIAGSGLAERLQHQIGCWW